jgi:hypothetical protein
MNAITLTWLEVISSIFGIFSFVFALVIYFVERELKKHLESGLVSLIGLLDTTALMGADPNHHKRDLALYAEAARNHAISLLRSFSKTNHRHETYNFGLEGRDLDDVIEKRKIATGVGLKKEAAACLLEGQRILTTAGLSNIEDLEIGSEIVGYEAERGLISGTVSGRSSHNVTECLVVNRVLEITESNLIFVRDRAWIEAGALKVGDQILDEACQWQKVFSIENRHGKFVVHAIETSRENFFASGYLVHNKPN